MEYKRINLSKDEAQKLMVDGRTLSDSLRLALGLEPKQEPSCDGMSRQLKYYRKKAGIINKPERWRKN